MNETYGQTIERLRAALADASKALEAFRHDAKAREAMERIERVLKPADTEPRKEGNFRKDQ